MNTLETNLLNREFNASLYHSTHSDHESSTLWLPLWNLSGQMVGFQTYKPFSEYKKQSKDVDPRDLKYFTYVSKAYKTSNDTEYQNVSKLAVWGLDLLSRSNRLPKYCFLVEGVFDAVPFHNLNLNCLALLGVGKKANKPLLSFLRSLGYTMVTVCEGDVAGKYLSKYSDTALYLDDGQDPGDLKTSGVKSLLTKHGYL